MLTLHQIRQQFAVAIDYTDEDGLTVVRPRIGFDFNNNYVLTYELNDKTVQITLTKGQIIDRDCYNELRHYIEWMVRK